jgi:hypothetical protein
MSFANGFANEAGLRGLMAATPVRLVRDLGGNQRAADDQLCERVGHLAVRLKVGLNVPLHRERHVGVADALAQGLPVDLRVAASRACTSTRTRAARLGRRRRSDAPVSTRRPRA